MTFKKLILVVDDDEDIRESVVSILEGEGYSVIQAENGQVALELLKSSKSAQLPCGMILDLMMPVMDGKSLLDILHRDHSNDLAQIPVLVMSAMDRIEGLPSTVDRIKKPMEIEDFISAVERMCGKP